MPTSPTIEEINAHALTKDEIFDSAHRFATWLERVGYESYDPYDLWGTKYGLWSRALYYDKGKIGLPFIAPIVLADVLLPSVRKLFVQKERYATCDGQLVLAWLNLSQFTGDQRYLDKAVELGDQILEYSIKGYSGHCWGYPFHWRNSGELWPKNTPYITCTPYCYEAYRHLHDATGEPKYLELCESIARFVHTDLKETPTGANSAAGSYSPIDNSKVINASCYRSWLLFDAGKQFNIEAYNVSAEKNLNFILEAQREDGSWLYTEDAGKSNFIDNFHTCFNMKNLFKLNLIIDRNDVRSSIRSGFNYYINNLIDTNGDPKYFSVKPRFQIVKHEMYNFAEAITLGALLKHEIPEAFRLAHSLARKLKDHYQLAAGHYATRVFHGGKTHRFPFLRWPQAQLFYSMTNLLVATAQDPMTKQKEIFN